VGIVKAAGQRATAGGEEAAMSVPPPKLFRGRVADQIVDDLRRRILSGDLADGELLPSERDLASHYDVSAPTVREAVRVLAAMGLLNTRNGARTTVSARGDVLLQMSIASVVQFEKMGPGDVLGLLGALNEYAASLAVKRASDDEIAALRTAVERTRDVERVDTAAGALREFWAMLAAISHNPLLAALAKAINEIQLGIAAELSRGDVSQWQSVTSPVYALRRKIVDALEARDESAATEAVRDYHARIVKKVRSLPRAKQLRQTDPGLTAFLTEWLGANIGVSNRYEG
jgi:DNA-binding FadR family transcriptional regulator